MDDNKLNYNDVREYESLFTLAPSFLLERFAKRNSNLVLKFQPRIEEFINNLSDYQKNKLEIIVESEIEDLQTIMAKAYLNSRKKQYRILANPKYREFIKINLDELRKMIE